MTIRITGIKLPVETDFSDGDNLKSICAERLHIPAKRIKKAVLYKKSVDARKNRPVMFVCAFDITIDGQLPKGACLVKEDEYNPLLPIKEASKPKTVVVGSGPAGLFAALVLAKNGVCPIIVERGKTVPERQKDVDAFWNGNRLNPESNVQFGEGGAGTFSDGKLNTGINDPRCRYVLKVFSENGAGEEILYDAKPHIGTDRLALTVQNMRKLIIESGGKFLFEHRLVDFVTNKGKICGVRVENNGKNTDIECDSVVLAIGHSARDTFEMLKSKGIPMTQKAFSVGVRIEHRQEMINRAQYGNFAHNPNLGAADYKLSTHLEKGRGVYSFCMCPGGYVVGASSEENAICTNGMSYSGRNGENANSALLVSVGPDDFGSDDPLAGISFQRKIERKAFEIRNDGYKAPLQTVGDFIKNQLTSSLGNVEPTYKPGIKFCKTDEYLPDFVCDSLRQGIADFGKKIEGFDSPDALLTGPEARSSSPVRILRDKETFESDYKGLFPCGEGAGYAGGIMSAAVDGIKTAEAILKKHSIGD